jgi:hypothetical protein
MTSYYARVTTERGELVHLAEVATRNRSFSLEGLKTLCGHAVAHSSEGVSDPADCPACLTREKTQPRARRSEEAPSFARSARSKGTQPRSGALYVELSSEDRTALEQLVADMGARSGRPMTRAEVVRALIRAAAGTLEG